MDRHPAQDWVKRCTPGRITTEVMFSAISTALRMTSLILWRDVAFPPDGLRPTHRLPVVCLATAHVLVSKDLGDVAPREVHSAHKPISFNGR